MRTAQNGLRASAGILAAAIAVTVNGGARADTKPAPRPSGPIETFETLDRMCGEAGAPATQAASCGERDKLYAIIKAQGWCKGRVGQAPSDRRWYPCGPKSL